jgi:radical SAM superfamily enzyme YgiQ (UPF0313 family)
MRQPEALIIRPPTEARSLLLRVTRGCNWNRCRFCGIYSHFGQPNFELRAVEEVLADIEAAREAYGPDWAAAFLGDADPLVAPPQDLLAILRHLRATFPAVRRVTCYARASTCHRRREHLPAFHQAGLSRVHVGLETGSDALLRFHQKGSSQKLLMESGLATREAGLELSYYILLGLGGADRWEEHVRETLVVLNAVQPEFVRFRRLWIYGQEGGPACPLWDDVQSGRFTPQTPEGTVLELRAIVAGVTFPTEIEAIHHNVHVRLGGHLPESRERMLAKLDAFLARPEAEKAAVYEQASVI